MEQSDHEPPQIDDLIPRAELFRSKLIDSFQLLDSLQGNTDIPKYYSSELAESPKLMDKMMVEAPHGLVKFKVYSHSEEKKGDRRLNKVRMKSAFGIYCFGPWAKEICDNKNFQNFMSILIVLNSLVLAVQGEVMHYDDVNIQYMSWCLDMFDLVSLIIFVFEIILKLTDQPVDFWRNGWNRFDFLITLFTLVVAIIDNLDNSAKGNFSGLAMLKGLRILRSLKMLTRFAQLRLIVLTILKALHQIGIIFFLIGVVMYLFSVMGLIFFKDYSGLDAEQMNASTSVYGVNVTRRFETFSQSLVTVVQLFTVDNWFNLFLTMENDGIVHPAYYYVFILLWLFIGNIMFKNIFVGIMVINFTAIRKDFIEQCLEREEDLEVGQKGLLLEVELAMQHANQSHTSLNPPGRTSLELGGFSGLIPFLSAAPGLPGITEADFESPGGSTVSMSSQPLAVPFSQSIRPSISEEEMSAQLNMMGSASMTSRTSNTSISKSDISALLQTLRETRSIISDDGKGEDKNKEKLEFPENKSWNDTVRWNFQNFETNIETLWPRDTLFRYIQLMEAIQDNLAERHQLQRLAVRAISNMFDSKY